MLQAKVIYNIFMCHGNDPS